MRSPIGPVQIDEFTWIERLPEGDRVVMHDREGRVVRVEINGRRVDIKAEEAAQRQRLQNREISEK